MREGEINEYARQLLDAHGAQAVVEAAQKAVNFEKQGENEQAQTWRQAGARVTRLACTRASLYRVDAGGATEPATAEREP